jgi:uncharacterized protein with ParB-like and HNH nuclease domain
MAELQVNNKTIGKLFSEMQNRKFIIPEYQRPYKWDNEKCETLWEDIADFAGSKDAKEGHEYFLGTIVSFVKEDKNQEIIDGQQRITSFLLMLRAFYRKLEDMTEDEDVIGLKNQLAPCIWDINPISQKVSDKSKIHIESQVVTEEDNATFHQILETGIICKPNPDDNYSKNYRFFKGQCDKYAQENPMQWKQLCVTILQKCIILPIECVTQERALAIFSTLNDRGMPLADSDIFKAQIYRNFSTDEQRKKFTDTWKDLFSTCQLAHLSIDDIFRYYTHVLRAKKGEKGKEIGLRSFYAKDKYESLKEVDLMQKITTLADFWKIVNMRREPDENDGYTILPESRQLLHCLSCYPNDHWKYVVTVFFMQHKASETFAVDFSSMLKKLTAFLFTKFISHPTVNVIKEDIFAACIDVYKYNGLQFKYDFDEADIRREMEVQASRKLSRALLLLDAYLFSGPTESIPEIFDVEHIFPKKWQDTNYNGWSFDDAHASLDRFGNKIVIERKLNTQAGNGYFGIKKQKYASSKIACVKALSQYPKNDWLKEDIEQREMEFRNRLITFFRDQLDDCARRQV